MSDNPYSKACDPQDIEATLGFALVAVCERDTDALNDLFWKAHLQLDALQEEYTASIANPDEHFVGGLFIKGTFVKEPFSPART